MAVAPERLRAERLVLAGCYECLQEAAAIFERLAGDFPTSRDLRISHITTLLLLATRARELGLTARWEADMVSALEASDADPILDLYRRVSGQVAPPLLAGTPEAIDAMLARMTDVRRSIDEGEREDMVERAQSDPVAAHFLLMLSCAERSALPLPVLAELPQPVQSTPLVSYAAGACSAAHADALEHALRQEPRFHEVRYHRGVLAAGRHDYALADGELTLAREAFPDAAPFALAHGHVHFQLHEYQEGLDAFDRVLATAPVQRDALLGRIRALSYLNRFHEAIAGADYVLELGTWLQGDAYYWRAWNHRQLRELEAAARDIESAKGLLFNADVPKLAGFIAYERGLLEDALTELEAARERDPADCDVPFVLGLVRGRRQEAEAGAGSFAGAADCAAGAQQGYRSTIAEIEAMDFAATRKAALRARAERGLDAARRQEGLAVLNAARLYLGAGRLDEARSFALRAQEWEAHREDAGRLLDRLRP